MCKCYAALTRRAVDNGLICGSVSHVLLDITTETVSAMKLRGVPCGARVILVEATGRATIGRLRVDQASSAANPG
jgi:hypothetical protein